MRISGSNARYTMFRGSVKGTGYTLHSPVSSSLPLPCVTVCHHISTGAYHPSRRHSQLPFHHYVPHEELEVDQSVAPTNISHVALPTDSSLQHRARHAHPTAWIISWSVDCTQYQDPEDHNINIFVTSSVVSRSTL